MTEIRGLAARFIETLEARDWESWAALLHPDVIYEVPQTGERIRGRERYLRFNQEYPGHWHLRLRRAISEGRHAVAWFDWTGGGGSDDGEGIVFIDFDDDGLITRLTDYWPERYEPPSGRDHLVERR